jgi:hypothetical protein
LHGQQETKKSGTWILKAPKHSREKNRNLQTGSAHATIFAIFGLRFGQLALPVCSSPSFLIKYSLRYQRENQQFLVFLPGFQKGRDIKAS